MVALLYIYLLLCLFSLFSHPLKTSFHLWHGCKGKTISINVVAVMARAAQESNPSKTIHITCPRRPPAPTVSQQPSYKRGCVLLAWDKPRGHPDTSEETISAYSIFVDGQWHGEVKASRMGDQQGYQFFLTDLAPEQSYDVSVKVRSGMVACHCLLLTDLYMCCLFIILITAALKVQSARGMWLSSPVHLCFHRVLCRENLSTTHFNTLCLSVCLSNDPGI